MKVLQILKESSPPDLMKGFEEFLPLVMNVLGINKLPPIKIVKDVPGAQPSFGGFDQDSGIIYIQITNRHPLDIFRTLAHELVHFKQDTEHKLDGESGRTGSPMENEANATAGIVMRHFNKQYPEYLGQSPLIKEDVNESLTPNTIHKLADRKGVKWDNEPSFLRLTKQLTGKEHLDDLDQADLQKVKHHLEKQGVAENFADGKNPGRKGLAKRSGVNTKASVSDLRKTAKNSSGEKQRMAHWLANMKAGRAK
jgi:hypothetical protein